MTYNMDNKKHILSLLVENEPGVLARISGLFSGRGFNIESLCVAETNEENVSRVTLVTIGDMNILEQIKKQLNKLISVVKVLEFTGTPYVQRELVLIKIKAKQENKAEILRIVDIFRSRIVDVSLEYYTIEVTGTEDKITAIIELLRPFGIKEIARTGAIALAREKK